MKQFSIEDINIIYEDNHILVVVKPQNMACCPDNSGDKDMLSLLKEYLINKYDKKGEAFLGLVHRLDRPTGGVMVYAKTSKAAQRLSQGIRENDIEKKYLAVVVGKPRDKQNQLVHYLLKNSTQNKVYSVPMATDGAKKAILNYKVLEENGNYSLIDIRLITGRSHQIRVQFSSIGCPLYGDQKYGEGLSPIDNIALWATELKFSHPITKERLVYRVYPPIDNIPWKLFDVNRFLAINIKY